MGLSSTASSTPSTEFLAVFRAQADASGAMTFAKFMGLALYHPEVGYYRRDRPRVGYGEGTDFYTASTSGPIFGELVAVACASLLRAAGRDPAAHTFVEIGAESADGVLADVTHPFARVLTQRIGAPLEISGDCVVFSNELFDAQPCIRTVFRSGEWREIGVRLEGERLIETERPLRSRVPLPMLATEGYRFDAPIGAVDLLETIAAQSWRGLFVACDYGKTLRELSEEAPAGTVRAYHRHTQTNDVLARPGEQDLTCHVCWDWLADALSRHGFAEPALQFQESFFMRHAGEAIASISQAEAARLSQRKLALLQLLHPAHLGQKFQVLHALR